MSGNPLKINALMTIQRGAETVTVTIAERVIELVRQGSYIEEAAASAGIHKDSIYEWQRIGGVAAQKLAVSHEVTEYEQLCADFAAKLDQARGEYFVQANLTLERIGRGGAKRSIVTTKKDADGKVIETTERIEEAEANAAVLMWRLKRLNPARYSDRIELTGPEGGPIEVSLEERASALADKLRDFNGVTDEPAAVDA